MSVTSLAYKINADASSLGREMRFAERRVQRFSRRAESQVRKVGKAFATMGGLVATALIAMTNETIKQASEMGAAAARVGMLSEEYSALQFAAQESKVELGAFERRIQRFNREISQASQGVGGLVGTLSRYDIELRNADRSARSQTEILMDLADAVVNAEDSYEQAGIAAAAFGSRGAAEMLPFLMQGADGIEELTNRADELGLTFSTELTDAADQVEANMRALRNVTKRFALQVGSQTLPIIQRYSGALVASANDTNEVTSSTHRLSTVLQGGLASVEAIRTGFVILSEVLGAGAAAAVEVGKTFFQNLTERGRLLGDSIFDLVHGTDHAGRRIRKFEKEQEGSSASSADRLAAIWESLGTNLDDIYKDSADNLAAIFDGTLDDIEASANEADASGFLPDEAVVDEAADRMRELEGVASRWFRDTRTDAEKYAAAMAEVGEAFGEGLIDEETLKRAKRQIEETFDPDGLFAWEQKMFDLADAADEVIAEINGVDLAAQAHLDSLQELHDEGFLTWEQYRSAVDMAKDGLDDGADSVRDIQNETHELFDLAKSGAELLSGSIIDGVVDPFNTSIDEMLANFTQALARMALQAAAQRAISGGFGFSEGGPVSSFSTGGFVSGDGTSTSDSIPARLSDGEYVMRASSVDHYGLGFMAAINRGDFGRVEGFSQGGPVSGGESAPGGAGGEMSVKIVNIFDDSTVLDVMSGKQGERIVVNHLQNNKSKVGL